MRNGCIYFKIRSKKGQKYFYCALNRQIVTYDTCRSCKNKEYKQYKSIRKRTYKQAKREKQRFSIIYPYLDKCCVCGTKTGIILHECIYGRNRQNSIKYGLVIPLCVNCHTGTNGIHNNYELDSYYHKLAQCKWEQVYGDRDEFINIFKSNYLK